MKEKCKFKFSGESKVLEKLWNQEKGVPVNHPIVFGSWLYILSSTDRPVSFY